MSRTQFRTRQLAWMRETVAAVVVSEEQGEVDRFSTTPVRTGTRDLSKRVS